MNIDDVKNVDIPAGSLFGAMFGHQLALAMKYEHIEKRNGFWHPPDVRQPIDSAQFQNWLKNMFWRATEEVAEAFEPMEQYDDDALHQWESEFAHDPDIRHFFEELADATHFIIEASVYARISPQTIDDIWMQACAPEARSRDLSDLRMYAFAFISGMGLAANCLKNKPWKETQMPTDERKFNRRLVDAWLPFCKLWVNLGCNLTDVYQLYMRKNAVNQFRQNTRY